MLEITRLINNCKTTIAITAATFALTLATPKQAKAHEINVHQWITEQAVDYICKKKEYKEVCTEIKPLTEILKEGVVDEDTTFPAMNKATDYHATCNPPRDTRTRFFKHFLRPIDGKGYFNWTPTVSHQFENAMQWGLKNPNNLCDLENALAIYNKKTDNKEQQNQNKKRAYYALAHVLHLIQDVTLPEHTQLEAHAYIGSGIRPQDIVILNQFGFEHYADITLQKTNKLPVPKKNEQFKIRSIEDYFKLGSMIAYTINRFPANLENKTKRSAELGTLGKMFPSLHYQDAWVDLINIGWRIDSTIIDSTDDKKNKNKKSIDWQHDLNPQFEGMWRGSYALVDDWWQTKSFAQPPNEKEEPGWYYIEGSMQAFPKLFKIGWPKQFTELNTAAEIEAKFQQLIKAENESYYQKIKSSTPKSLAALLADELIPLAIQNTAGSLIWYWQQVHQKNETNQTEKTKSKMEEIEKLKAAVINAPDGRYGIYFFVIDTYTTSGQKIRIIKNKEETEAIVKTDQEIQNTVCSTANFINSNTSQIFCDTDNDDGTEIGMIRLYRMENNNPIIIYQHNYIIGDKGDTSKFAFIKYNFQKQLTTFSINYLGRLPRSENEKKTIFYAPSIYKPELKRYLQFNPAKANETNIELFKK